MRHKSPVLLIGILSLCLHVSAAGQSDSWETNIQTGDNAIAQKRYADAEQAYREALKAAEKFKEKDPRLAVNLIKLAESLNLQAKREEAEALANRAIVALDKALKDSKSKDSEKEYYKTESSVTILNKAAGIFVANKKPAEAEPLYKRVVALREEAAPKKETPKSNEDFMKVLAQNVTHAQSKLADAYDTLATFYLNQSKFEEAEPLYLKAVKAIEAEYGAGHPMAALSLSRLATFYAMQGKHDKAEPLYLRAIKIFEESDWMDRPQVANTFENYSRLLTKTGRETEAAAMLEKAKAIRMKIQRSPN